MTSYEKEVQRFLDAPTQPLKPNTAQELIAQAFFKLGFLTGKHPAAASLALEISDLMEKLKEAVDAQDYKIDMLMLEYCPQEMTREQILNFAAHQQKVLNDLRIPD